MLFWVKFIFFFTCILLCTLNLFLKNLISIILTSEFIVVLIFFMFLFNGVLLNLNWLFSFSFIVVILGGLEVALSFLLLNL